MKYVFFGTPRFAAIVLQKLIDAGIPPVAVVSNPDRPVGRKKIITPPPVKTLAVGAGAAHSDIDILQPDKLDENFMKRLRALEPDFFVVAAFAKIIPASVLAIPRLGTIGTHPSLLPKYRGASPIQAALLHGDAITGTTLYLMDEKMDSGPVLAQTEFSVPSLETAPAFQYPDLEEKLAELSGNLLVKTIHQFFAGALKPKPQNESQATFTKKFTTENGFIDEKIIKSAQNGDKQLSAEILRKINALNPEPGTWTIYHDAKNGKGGKRVKLLEAKIQNDALRLVKIQEEGGVAKAIT